jgi:hypothetical protein
MIEQKADQEIRLNAGGKQRLCFKVLHDDFLLDLFFDHEDGGYIFLRNFADFQRTTSRYIAENKTVRS